MNAMQLLTGPISQSIGWALLHLLWQATIVAGILAAVLALLPRQAATTRYAAACSALALVFVMFVATAIRAYDPAAQPIVTTQDSAAANVEPTAVSLAEVPALLAATATAGWRDRAVHAVATARQWLPSIVGLWLAGVVLLSTRLLVSWLRARRLVTHGTREAGVQWQRAAARISEALGLDRAVLLLESAAVEVPSVLGSLRPVILLPASTLTGLTPEQIEMVLAHELAHIRRHDFLVNLMQAFVETLMFYHPAIWWMSRSVRIERENCCDDMAVAVCGNPIQYARALTRLEELRAETLPVAVAANGGSLLDRIRRIAAGRAESTGTTSRWTAAVVMLVVLAAALAVPSLPALAQRDDDDSAKKAEKAEAAKTQVDVVEAAEPATPVATTEYAWHAASGVPVEPPDVDIEIPDVDIELPDVDVEVPEMPAVPGVPGVPAIAPYPLAAPYPPATPRPDIHIAPMAVPSPVLAPAPARTPRPSRPPHPPTAMAAVMFGDGDDHDDDNDREEDEKDFGGSGKLTVDELIQLRAVGVTSEYISQMRAVFPELKLRSIANLRAVGVTPAYISEMRKAGFEIKSARDIQQMSAVGVTGEWLRAMRDAGFEIKTAREATSLRAVGVTPEYISEMRKAGFDVKSAHDIQSMSAVGVTGEWLRAMRDAGIDIKTARDATQLRAVGVTPELVRQLASAGYSNLSVRELSSLAAVGINSDFIRDMEKYRDKK